MNFSGTDSEIFNKVNQDFSAKLSDYANYNIENIDLSVIKNSLPQLYLQAIELTNDLKINKYDQSTAQAKYNQLQTVLSEIKKTESSCQGFTNMEGYDNIFDNNTSTLPNNPTMGPYPSVIPSQSNNQYIQGLPNDNGKAFLNNKGGINYINNYKIKPLQNEISTYKTLVNNINKNYTNIIQTSNNIQQKYNILSNNNVYDFSSNDVNIEFKNPTLEDQVVEDTTTMAYTENSIYMLGSMTAAIMLIIAVYVARE
jgi:hypothetical protein